MSDVRPEHCETLAADLFAVRQRVLVDYGHQSEVAEWECATAEERAPWLEHAEDMLLRLLRITDRDGDA